MKAVCKQILCLLLVIGVSALELPGSCNSGQYYEPGLMECVSCPANVSMVVASDGFGCTCEAQSVPAGVARCRPCNTTEMLSADGRACVPRRCQASAGRVACRKCPSDYISVTQNLDGSTTKEVQCVKCAKGYKPERNSCVRCDACVCARSEALVSGQCVPKRFVNDRPKFEGTTMHPFEVLDIVKNEFLCTQNDVRACRSLTDACVRNFYSTDLAGPCRLWIQPKIVPPKGLAQLTIESTTNDKIPGEITLKRGVSPTLKVAFAVYTASGGLDMLRDSIQTSSKCLYPFNVTIGNDFSVDCVINVAELDDYANSTVSPFLHFDGDLKPIPVSICKPSGYHVQRGTWSTTKFRRYFLKADSLSTTTNGTNTVYLRTLIIRLQVQRDKYKPSSLRLRISMEAQYITKSTLSQSVRVTVRMENEMPSAGVLRGLEIWGAVLGALLSLYATVQWRGCMRRGGPYAAIVPLLAGSVSDALYFAAWFSTLHALAAEAGTLGMTLPLSHSEDHMIQAFVYAAVALKVTKVIWINWNQCRCDIFFLDWSEYYPLKETVTADKATSWRASALAREWTLMQTRRRVSPGCTAAAALVILHLMSPWLIFLPQSRGYKWALASLAWWAAYVLALAAGWLRDLLRGPPTAELPRVCSAVGLSLLVFQEEYYAHYVHGRNDDSDGRSMAGPLSACRVVCAPQLRVVYKQLSTPGLVTLGEKDTKRALLSRFLAAFFERALDGLSWVASERTIPERLLDVELTARESGNTSALLYDPDGNTPSCFMLSWWGEEWSLGTFDGMLFGCVYLARQDPLLAALVTLVLWQVLQQLRSEFGNRNLKNKTVI